MFGNTSFNQQNQPQQQQQQGMGLFGNTGGSTGGGGLFGNVNPQPQQQQQQPQMWGGTSTMGTMGAIPLQKQGESLFNQPSNIGTTGGGLLGQKSQVGGGMFSQPQQATTQTQQGWGGGSSLFGQPQQTSTTTSTMGIYGQQQPQQQQSGMGSSFGLFGQKPQQPQQPQQPQVTGVQGGLFGSQISQPQQQQGGGLFTGIGGGLQQLGGQQLGGQQLGGQQLGGQQLGGQQLGGQQLGGQQLGGQQLGGQQQGLFNQFGGQGQQLGGQGQQLLGTGMFGGTQQQMGTGLGGQSSLFGQSISTTTQPLTGTSSLFGTKSSGGMFGQPQQQGLSIGGLTGGIGTGVSTGFRQSSAMQQVLPGTYSFPYQPSKAQESSNLNGHQKLENINLVSITGMNEYKNKSFEELRYEDYCNKKKGLTPNFQSGGMGMTMTSQQIGGGLSSSSSTLPTSGGLFGQKQPSTGGLFTQTTTSSTGLGGGLGGTGLGSSSGLGFGSTLVSQQTGGLFQQNQPQQQQTGMFGQTSGVTGMGGMLNQPQQQQQQQQQGGGLFGSTTGTQLGGDLFKQTTTQPSTQGGLFGQTGSTLGLGGQQQGGLLQQTNVISPPKSTGGLFAQQQPTLGLGLGQQQTGGLGQQQQQTGGLFGSSSISSLGGQPSSTTGGLFTGQPSSLGQTSLFTGQQKTQQGGGLFAPTGTTTQPQGGLFTGISTTRPQEAYQSQQVPMQQIPQTGTPLFSPQSTDYQNFLLSSLSKQKSITDVLNDLQKQYLEQDFYFDEYKRSEKPKEINLLESKYAYVPVINENEMPYPYENRYKYQDSYDPYLYFLKSKRTYQPPTRMTNIYSYRETPKPTVETQKLTPMRQSNLLDFDYNQTKSKSKFSEDDEIKLVKKSHSCDLIKKNEKIIVNKLEQSFNEKINLEDENRMKQRKNQDNIYLDLHISLQDPIKTSFNLKFNKNSKLSLLKNAIVDHLKEKYPRYFKKLNKDSFVLMKKYSILKDVATIGESEVKDGDAIHILLKETFSGEVNEGINNSSKKESSIKDPKTDKKKKKVKNSLAPIEKLPILTKQGYKTNPSMLNINRMTLDDLEEVEDFCIYNEFGRIDFEGTTNLTNLNLDQIVNIEDKRITVYQNGDLDFKPPVGQGLNKSAILHLYNCFPQDGNKNITDEQMTMYLATLQKICKDKGAEFKSYDKNTGEWIFKVNNFV